MFLSDAERQVFYDVADKLRISNPEWLIDLVKFETAGTFSPKIKNPLSSGRGLIQFMDSTAIGLGYANSLDLVEKNPTITEQLMGPVYDYLRPYSPFNDEFQLYMAVFFPAARNYSEYTPFSTIFKDLYGSNWESKYQSFITANKGILTPQDYVNRLKKKSTLIQISMTGGIMITVLMLWYYLKKR